MYQLNTDNQLLCHDGKPKIAPVIPLPVRQSETPGTVLTDINQIFYKLNPWQQKHLRDVARRMLEAKQSDSLSDSDEYCPF